MNKTKPRINKQELENRLFNLKCEYHRLFRAQVAKAEDGLTYADEGYQELSKAMADIESEIRQIKGELGQ